MMFSQNRIDAYAEKAIPQIPPGKTGVIIAARDDSGARVALEFEKKTSHGTFSAVAVYAHDWNGDNTIEGQAMFSW